MSVVFGCAEADRFVDVYVDGEFEGEEQVEMERHLAVCETCARLVRRHATFKADLKTALPRPAIPEGARARVLSALSREPAGGALAIGGTVWQRAGLGGGLAAAAALLVLAWQARPQDSMLATAAITSHARDLPVEVRGPAEDVRAWFSHKVDFAVRPPVLPNGALVGARLANLRDRQAAYLVYNVQGQKVSVFVFDPQGVPLESRHRRHFGDTDVWLEGEKGYNVAVYRDRGIGYAIASDLDEDQMVNLVSQAVAR